MAGQYDYDELRKAAESGKKDDIKALGEWLNRFGIDFWNGEYYDADGIKIRPVYREFYAVQVRFPGSDGWQDICVTDDPDGEIEHQRTIENEGNYEYRAELDHAEIVGYAGE